VVALAVERWFEYAFERWFERECEYAFERWFERECEYAFEREYRATRITEEARIDIVAGCETVDVGDVDVGDVDVGDVDVGDVELAEQTSQGSEATHVGQRDPRGADIDARASADRAGAHVVATDAQSADRGRARVVATDGPAGSELDDTW
jgi:hypothetical protein